MSNRSKSRGGRPSKYAPEFRRDAVAMVLDEHRILMRPWTRPGQR
jgi:hypothetical protein